MYYIPIVEFVDVLTGVNCSKLMSIKCKRRQTGQIVFLINIVVGCLYKVDVFFLAFIVDVLQFVEDLLCLLIPFGVCGNIKKLF